MSETVSSGNSSLRAERSRYSPFAPFSHKSVYARPRPRVQKRAAAHPRRGQPDIVRILEDRRHELLLGKRDAQRLLAALAVRHIDAPARAFFQKAALPFLFRPPPARPDGRVQLVEDCGFATSVSSASRPAYTSRSVGVMRPASTPIASLI